jgi:tRNA C32,U32 (ribose-2'-O)-methylase TrmJ
MTYWLGVTAIFLVAVSASIAVGWAMRRMMGWKVNTLVLVAPAIGVAIGVVLTHWK